MELGYREISLENLRAENKFLRRLLTGTVAGIVGLIILLLVRSTIVLLDVPGMPNGSQIGQSSMDMGAQRAVLLAVTSNLVQTNPANANQQKTFLKAFLAPDQYTRIALEIDQQVEKLASQHELGSYYWVWSGQHEYDAKLDRHFIIGDVHTVNAARDTAQQYVYEYKMHVFNYRPVIDDIQSYPGDKPHNSAWIEAAKK